MNIKYGIYVSDTRKWAFPDCIHNIGYIVKMVQNVEDHTFETCDINIAYRYLEYLRKFDTHRDFLEVKEG